MTKPVMPRSIQIGFRNYTIIEWDHNLAMVKGLYGEQDSVASEIRVDTAFPKQQVAETLLHEVLHAIYVAFEFQCVQNPSEEYLVSITASGLIKVLMDNPEFATFLMESTA